MKPRPVEVVILLETDATLKYLQMAYKSRFSPGKILRVDVFTVKQLKATEGGVG